MNGERKEFVVGVLCKSGSCLAEKRKMTEEYFAGRTIFPGGHMEPGESPEHAIVRELNEELGVTVKKFHHLADYVYDDGHPLHVFAITAWEGEPVALEAESILWVSEERELSDELNRDIFRKLAI